jgi:hypothetical protein
MSDKKLDAFRKVVRDRFPATVTPERAAQNAQDAVVRGSFADQMKEQFFDQAFGEVLADVFMAWLKTESHCVKEREFLYATAMALGSVKGKLIDFSNLGKNTSYLQNQQKLLDEAGAHAKQSSQEGTEDADQDGSD